MNRVHEQKMRIAEIRMFKWTFGHTMMNKIKNECTKKNTRVAVTKKNMLEIRLRLFRHVQLKTFVRHFERLDTCATTIRYHIAQGHAGSNPVISCIEKISACYCCIEIKSSV